MTNETDAWNSFFQSGSVLDYLQYKAIQKARKEGKRTEDKDEVFDQRSGDSPAEYR